MTLWTKYRPLAAALLTGSALAALPVPAAAETKTFGADLSRPANGTADCTVLPNTTWLGSGVSTCTWWSIGSLYDSSETNAAPYPGGVVKRIRVKVGPITGRMRIDVIRLRRQAQFTGPAACCFATGVYSPEFTPTANSITTVDVNLPVSHSLNPVSATWDFDTLAITVLDPGVPVPVHETGDLSGLGNGAGSMFPAVDQGVEIRVDPHAAAGYQVLLSADVELAGTTTKPPPPPPPPVIPVRLGATQAMLRSGAARVPVICGATGRCTGELRLTASVAGSAKRRTATIASGRFRISAGKRASVKVKLTAAGRRFMRTRRSARVGARLYLGRRLSRSASLTLRR